MVGAIDRMPNVFKDVKEVQSFVGMMQYFALYIPMMAQFRKTLTDLTKMGVPFHFTTAHDDGNYSPIRFMSRGFGKYEQAQENREREMRAGWFCMLKCHSMLEHTVFTWFTDHANVRWAMDAKSEHQCIARLAIWLSMYNYNLQHLAGKHILLQIVDCISRLPIPDSQEDREIFSPFERQDVVVALTTNITDRVLKCPRSFEISTDTRAQLTRCGVDIIPRIAGIMNLDRRCWKLPLQPVMRYSTIANVRLDRPLPSYESHPTLTGLEMFGSFPTAVTAMRRFTINVCATVGSLSDLAETASDSPSERFETLHFDDAEALTCAIPSERVELPDFSILHSTLGVCQSPQLKIGAHFAAVKQAEQTLNLVSDLNAMQACHPSFIAMLVMPFKLLSTLRPVVARWQEFQFE